MDDSNHSSNNNNNENNNNSIDALDKMVAWVDKFATTFKALAERVKKRERERESSFRDMERKLKHISELLNSTKDAK